MAGDDKKYKKRVIQAASDDEASSDDDAPLASHDPPLAHGPRTAPCDRTRATEKSVILSSSVELTSLKRVKAEQQPQASTANANVAPASDALPRTDSLDAIKAANAPLPPPVDLTGATETNGIAPRDSARKLAIFTTGSDEDDSEDDKPLVDRLNNGHSNGRDDSDVKQQQVKQQLEKEAELEQKVGQLVDKVDQKMDQDANDSSSEDDKPLAQKAAAAAGKNKKKQPTTSAKRASKTSSSSSSSKPAQRKKTDYVSDEDSDMAELTPEPSDQDSDSEADEPLAKRAAAAKRKKAPAAKAKKPAAKKVKTESNASTPQKAAVSSKSKGKGKAKKEEDEDAGSESGTDTYKWWEHDQNNETKWKTLEHNGVLFPPEYEPHGVKMKYDGKPVTLPPEAEEVASFYAALLETDYVKNPTFVDNFFSSFKKVLEVHPPLDGTRIKDYGKCDFTPIFAYLETEKEKKKSLTAAQKKANKAARDEIEEPFKWCLLDGRKEKVGNFRIEPPGLFRGRGQHPKTGMLKTRVRPEQITINIGKGVKVPEPPAGHQWGDIVHDDKVTWLATWKENVNNNVKYVFLAAGSSLKGQSDFKKFEKARALKQHIDRIRRDYTRDLKDKEMATRQRATAMYLIDRFALRAGNEKGDDEADTVGCCSLRYEHVTLTPPTKVTFDFLGKDSIRFYNEVEVDEQIFKNLKIFKKEPKDVGDMLFDRLNVRLRVLVRLVRQMMTDQIVPLLPSSCEQTSTLNKYLTSYMDGLTAKVFRTYNASWTFAQQLKDTPADASVADKLLFYNRANRMVAILCNHQRAVSKGHAAAMEKMTDKIRDLKYQRMKLRKSLIKQDKKYKKLYGEDESDLEDEWIVEHEHDLVEREREKIRKKFDKENQKLQEENEKPMKDSELKERLKAADDLAKKLAHERKMKYEANETDPSKLKAQIEKLDERIKVAKTNATDKDEGKEIALSTSKINYIDPRISVAWCKKYDVPINKVFSKTLYEKFVWAQESAEADFEW
ncbi:DNA topoisomerase 1 [Microbotryomycetes sp. JL201]|nr:DNA topoisomerase 1 [Microbotryomycetes sp. JL201]